MQRKEIVTLNIFNRISDIEIKQLTECLQAVQKTYKKGEIIVDICDTITSVGYVLDGSVQLMKDDYEGNKIILGNIFKGDTFAEAMVCAGIEESLVRVEALEDTKILFLDYNRIISSCHKNCQFHKKLLDNIIKTISHKNVILQEKIELLSKKTLKERILYMLYKEKNKNKNKNEIFEIPYSREEMAEFIGADRSALSRELSKLKDEKVIDYHKNMFKFYN